MDTAILVLLGFEVLSGLASLVGGSPDWAWLFVAHAIAGLSLVVLVAWKIHRVWSRVRRPEVRPDHVASSVLLSLLAVVTLATGIIWTMIDVVRIGGITLLTIHMILGLLLVPVLLWHLRHRFRLPASRDIEGRRTELQFTATVGVAVLVWRLQDILARLAGLLSAEERFTGSKQAGGDGNDFPVTSWVADDPDPIDPDDWTLTVDGAVDLPIELTYEEVSNGAVPVEGTDIESAILDCTSGWYAERDWQGVRIGDLLSLVDPSDEARWVSVRSVTGYRWSFPIDDVTDALLATHVDGRVLSHGHGAPLRLVVPGRRGFQWVKWIETIELRRQEDLSQWIAIFVSGLID